MKRFVLLLAFTLLALAGCKNEDSVTDPTPSGYVVGKNRFTSPRRQAAFPPHRACVHHVSHKRPSSLRYDSLRQRVILHPRPVHFLSVQPIIRAIGIFMCLAFDQRDAKTVARVRCEWRERGNSNGICISTDGKVRV